MNYGFVAGILVTLSLLLLVIESFYKRFTSNSSGFIYLYGAGVVCWLILGISMNNSSLVIISCLQIFSLAIFANTERSNHE